MLLPLNWTSLAFFPQLLKKKNLSECCSIASRTDIFSVYKFEVFVKITYTLIIKNLKYETKNLIAL